MANEWTVEMQAQFDRMQQALTEVMVQTGYIGNTLNREHG